MAGELYATLDIEPGASEKEIKAAWRKLAKATHPDQGGDEADFRRVQEAYEVLSDSERRRIYDRYGETDPQDTLARLGEFAAFMVDPENADHILDPARQLESVRRVLEERQRRAERRHEAVKEDLEKLAAADDHEDLRELLAALQELVTGFGLAAEDAGQKLEICRKLLDQYRTAIEIIGRMEKPKSVGWIDYETSSFPGAK